MNPPIGAATYLVLAIVLSACQGSDGSSAAFPPEQPSAEAVVTNSEELTFAKKRVRRIAEMERRGKLIHDTIRFACPGGVPEGFYVRSYLAEDLVRVTLFGGSAATDFSLRSTIHLDRELPYAIRSQSAPKGDGASTRSATSYFFAGNLIAREGDSIPQFIPIDRLSEMIGGNPPCP